MINDNIKKYVYLFFLMCYNYVMVDSSSYAANTGNRERLRADLLRNVCVTHRRSLGFNNKD